MDPIALIPIHFEQLKELRNGVISYIQIIKRDQTRPPVRPVCRKLGVSKLSEIKSEADLYDALVCVAQGQAQKHREHDTENSGSDSARSFDDNKLLRPLVDHLKFRPVLPSSNVGGIQPWDHQEQMLENSLEFKTLLDCVMHIRVAWDPRDRSQRLDLFAYQFGLDEKYLLNALKRICEILGCIHISPQIDVHLVVSATKIYFKQMQHFKKMEEERAMALGLGGNFDNNMHNLQMGKFSQYPNTFGNNNRPMEMNYQKNPEISPYNTPRDEMIRSARSQSKSNYSPRYVNDDISGKGFLAKSPEKMFFMKPNRVPEMSNPYNNNIYDSFKVSPRESDSNSYLAISSMKQSFFEMFWTSSFSLMRSISNPDVKSSDSIIFVNDLITMVESSLNLTPASVLALDCVVNKAVAALSFKVDKYVADGLNVCVAKDTVSLCVETLRKVVENPSFEFVRPNHTFKSNSTFQSLQEQLKWSGSLLKDSPLVLSNNSVNNEIESSFVNVGNAFCLSNEVLERGNKLKDKLTAILNSKNKNLEIELCGSIITKLGKNENFSVDVIANFPDTEMFDKECLETKKDILRRIAVLENALLRENQIDEELKYIQEVLTEHKITISELAKGSVLTSPSLSLLLHDSDLMAKIGEKMFDALFTDVQMQRKQPQIKALLEQLSFLKTQLNESLLSIETIKTQSLLNLATFIEKHGYNHVKIFAKYQEPVVKFFDSDSRLFCHIFLNRKNHKISSKLISSYYDLDESGKVKIFAGIIQSFVFSNSLTEELSSYGWNILIIHFLLRFNYLSNLPLDSVNSNSNKGRLSDDFQTLPKSFQEQINKTKVFDMLKQFFKYYSRDCDIFGNVLTLRGRGQVIPKSGWSKRRV